jgi:hypothetical protein
MGRYGRQIAPLLERWRGDIVLFAKEGLNFQPTWQQEELFAIAQAESTMPVSKRKKRIAVRSGQGPGKTTASAILAMWRVLRYEGALVVVTSPSMRQCKQWVDECARLLKDAHPLMQKIMKCYGTKVQVLGKPTWEIRTATASRPENLQGIHEKHLTFIADEASGVSPKIIETIQGTLSNPDSMFLAIGNPNTSSCKFYDFFTTNRDLWHCLHFNAEDTARDYPHIVSPDRNRMVAAEYGKDSDVYRVRVLGEFPREDPNNVMGIHDLEACTANNPVGCAGITELYDWNQALGIDFARYGSDESVVARRAGLAIVDYQIFVKREPTDVADYAMTLQSDAGWDDQDTWYVPDAGGMGQGVLGQFYRAKKRVLEFHTQGRPFDKQFADKYSEAWFALRELVRERICYLPKDQRLLKQLSTRQYAIDRKGKIKVETKDEWRKRLEVTESPDRADAIVMAFYPHLMGEARMVRKDPQDHKVGTTGRRRKR